RARHSASRGQRSLGGTLVALLPVTISQQHGDIMNKSTQTKLDGLDRDTLNAVTGGKGTGSAGGPVHSRGGPPVAGPVPTPQWTGLSLSDAYRLYGFKG